MKRLTKTHNQRYEPLDIFCLEWICDCLDRLATYEDTGLEPERVSDFDRLVQLFYSAGLDEKFVLACIELTNVGMAIDRLRELAQADREGRVVVLPCKKGDIVWRIVHDAAPHITKDRCTNIKYENGNIWVHLIGDRTMGSWNFGKLLFLTRAEAEAALRREQDD